MTSKLFGLFMVSEAWKARLPPYRLKATLAEVVLRGGSMAVFTSEGCDIEAGTISGDLWQGGRWTSTGIDALDVVACFGGAAVLRRQHDVLNWLSSRFPVIRACGPDKARLGAFLQNSPAAERIIPQDVLNPDDVKASIMSAMRLHGSIVVKPAISSSGRGVRFILRDGENWSVRQNRETRRGTMDEVAEHVAQDLGGRAGYRTIVIQKFVDSSTADGRALQLRVDVGKNGSSEWGVLRAFAQMAEIGERASNIAFGGYLGALEPTLRQRKVRPPSLIFDDAVNLALNTAKALDAHPEASIFELGVDMLLDSEDNVWLLEANLQPETTSYEQRRAEFAVDYAFAVASGTLPQATKYIREAL